jgi:hypothetical protein
MFNRHPILLRLRVRTGFSSFQGFVLVSHGAALSVE